MPMVTEQAAPEPLRHEVATLLELAAAIGPDYEAENKYRRALCEEAAFAERERAWSEGYAAAIADVKAAEHGAVDAIRLAVARSAPGGAVWLAAVERHGGTERGADGKPRVPVRPAVIERARQELGRAAR